MNDYEVYDLLAVFTGVITSGVYEQVKKSPEFDSSILCPLDPLANALWRTIPAFRDAWPADLPRLPQSSTLESAYYFFTQLIKDHRSPQTRFHIAFFDELLKEPVIADVVAYLHSPGQPPQATKRAGDTLLNKLLNSLDHPIRGAHSEYVLFHKEWTPGFKTERERWQSLPQGHDDNASVSLAMQETGFPADEKIVSQLAIALLHRAVPWNREKQWLVPDIDRTLVVWAWGGGKKDRRGGWGIPRSERKAHRTEDTENSPTTHITRALAQALLGPNTSGKRWFRSYNEITQGLIHWYYSTVLQFPFYNDVHVAYVLCLAQKKKKHLTVSLEANAPWCPICPVCADALDLTTHRIVTKDMNLVIPISEELHSSCPARRDPMQQSPPVWREFPLLLCFKPTMQPPLLGLALCRAATGLSLGPQTLAMLIGKRPDVVSETLSCVEAAVKQRKIEKNALLDTIGYAFQLIHKEVRKELKKVDPNDHERVRPALVANELRSRQIEPKPSVVETILILLTVFETAKRSLADEKHYIPDYVERDANGKKLRRKKTLNQSAQQECPFQHNVEHDAMSNVIHMAGFSERATAVYVTVGDTDVDLDSNEEEVYPHAPDPIFLWKRERAEEISDKDMEVVGIDGDDVEPEDTEVLDIDVARLAEAIEQVLDTIGVEDREEKDLVFSALGITKENLRHDEPRHEAGRRMRILMACLAKAKGDVATFEKVAAPHLVEFWRKASRLDSPKARKLFNSDPEISTLLVQIIRQVVRALASQAKETSEDYDVQIEIEDDLS